MKKAQASGGSADAAAAHCPSWCVTEHGSVTGEEDWVHIGAPLSLTDDTAAQLCLSVDPDTGNGDGPYVLIGVTERTLEEAGSLGASLIDLAESGAETTRREGA